MWETLSLNNYLSREMYSFSDGIGPGWIPNIHTFKDSFYEKSKIDKHKVNDDYITPFQFKKYDFFFEYDPYDEKLYVRYITTDKDSNDYETHSANKDGTIKELFEFFYDQYPDIINSIYYIYNL